MCGALHYHGLQAALRDIGACSPHYPEWSGHEGGAAPSKPLILLARSIDAGWKGAADS